MNMTDRQKQILEIFEKENFVTVKRLAELTYTSPSSIRRDLTYLAKSRVVHRPTGLALMPPGIGFRPCAEEWRRMSSKRKPSPKRPPFF